MKDRASLRLFLAPIYVTSFYIVFSKFLGKQTLLWRSFFFFACCGSLVPSALLEFRYFIVPLVFGILHADDQPLLSLKHQRKENIAEFICFMLVNILLLFIFIYLPFHSLEGSLSRFMW